ncbi:MAG: hypothetical protein Q4G34_10475 [Micrococcus sp.]|nr:hypothetical protein [Micrococcus sp.]
MTDHISRRRLTQGLAWSVPAVAAVSAAPLAAASEPGETPVDPKPPVDPEPPKTGACDCKVHWTADAVIDTTLDDYSNNGYGVIKKDDCGYLKTQHWGNPSATKVYWRIPMGTTHAIKAGTQLVLAPTTGNWTVDATVQDQTGTGAFARFTTITDRFGNAPSGTLTWTVQDGKLIVTLPEMPADSHIIFTVSGTPSRSVNDGIYGGEATVTGEYTADALKVLQCA